MMETELVPYAEMRLPALRDLKRPDVMVSLLLRLQRDFTPLIFATTDAIAEAKKFDNPERLLRLAEEIVQRPIPTEMLEYPAVIREAARASFNARDSAETLAKTIDQLAGFRPPDLPGRIGTVLDVLRDSNFSPAAVRLGCHLIRRANPGEFDKELPSPFHFVAFCQRAHARFEVTAVAIERAQEHLIRAQATLARRDQLETDYRERYGKKPGGEAGHLARALLQRAARRRSGAKN